MSALKKDTSQQIVIHELAAGMDAPRGRGKPLMDELITPLMDVYENEHSIMLEMDIPGMSGADIDISFNSNTVVISGNKHRKQEEEKVKYLCMEIAYANFRRAVTLQAPVNPHKATATYNRGVLRLTFPKILNKRGSVIKIPIT